MESEKIQNRFVTFLRVISYWKIALVSITFQNENHWIINSSRPNTGQREKIKLNLYFRTSLYCRKKFYEGLKGLHKFFCWGNKKKCENKKLILFL